MKYSAIIERDADKRKKLIGKIIGKKSARHDGGQALILVPEKHILDACAGMGTIFHAGLKISEKKDIWKKVASGEIQTIIGTQKALFLPYKNLATIVVDEEQHENYKLWDQYPRLHTVRGAQQLAAIHKAEIIYASSYPSIALRHAIQTGACTMLHNRPIALLPKVIQFSFEDRKWKRAVPDEASHAIRTWARKGLRVLVLHNKKDSVSVRDAITRRLGKQAAKNIYIGTTALLSDPLVADADRVVWLFPEFTMRTYDFRASERARILAARLQNITPKSSLLIATRHMDVSKATFESSEEVWTSVVLEERSRLHLSPFADLVRLTVIDKDDKKSRARAITVREILDEALNKNPACKVYGPFQEYKAKTKKKMHEYHLLLAGPLNTLVDIYKDVPVDSADVDPHRIV
ncbi:MAG: hypothetical protein A2805_02415 [Candidatus Andersenbacteria bacterium RIFCSPHIGHO2_01_FULL_46_36]|uniref:Helicase ATP-binding domain-containing protein n=1 Tax=Candidatus Andersenbacteria bacterium RIFCSPHIGHO2_12_FULL_45_11 TaxID=1797281 RepID=A0A1G1X215_9BACT|nr:MAG: hypothetical protein A2805_02415 [Candidatus Andersenbacteria bacterium RIFCSPHIGHO2_01_FULL_46_36]OGY34056.1 MAG: hypothetical protein A3D99_02255 [Candidatus Andersenbacteria bacterium RIFCSPHIGHO2_12_FULL_45_11]